jgi:hypothetical protein
LGPEVVLVVPPGPEVAVVVPSGPEFMDVMPTLPKENVGVGIPWAVLRVASCAAWVVGSAAWVVGSAAWVVGSAAAAASAFCTGPENPVKVAGATGEEGVPKLNKLGAGVVATGIADLGEAADKAVPPPPMPGVKLEGKTGAPPAKALFWAETAAAAVGTPLWIPSWNTLDCNFLEPPRMDEPISCESFFDDRSM